MREKGRNWVREELIVAFSLYCKTQFGHIHKSNPRIVTLAEKIQRTPSALAMKMVNFASLDPAHQARDVKGLAHASKQDEQIWNEFHSNWEELVLENDQICRGLGAVADEIEKYDDPSIPDEIETERLATVKVRVAQRFFREAVLSGYNFACSVCGLDMVKMLNASHIIPWAANEAQRTNPCNGLSLCAFHDRAFDRGLISLDDDYRIVLSKETRQADACRMHAAGFSDVEGEAIRLPDKFLPDLAALAYHRDNIFIQ